MTKMKFIAQIKGKRLSLAINFSLYGGSWAIIEFLDDYNRKNILHQLDKAIKQYAANEQLRHFIGTSPTGIETWLMNEVRKAPKLS